MCRRTISLVILGLSLTGCTRLGVCTKDQLSSVNSPTGRYSVEIVAKDCVGLSAVREVVLRRNTGILKGGTSVAVFDDSNSDRPANISVGWRGDRRILIQAHGAKVWAFQPNWRDVRVTER